MYLARIVGPSGMVAFLGRGRLVGENKATRYNSPSAAREAINGFRTKGALQGRIADVIDERDPERGPV